MGIIETLFSEEFEIDFNIEEVEEKCKIPESLLFPHSNSKYLAGTKYFNANYLELFDILSENDTFNLKKKYSINCEAYITDLNFHPKYTSLIALSLNNGFINIYEINDENQKDIDNAISEINAFDSYVQNILFNPYRDEIISSCSYEQLKIFDLNKYTCLGNYSLTLSNGRTVLKWKSDNLFAYSDNKGIIIDNYQSSNNSDKISIICNDKIKDFFFFNENNFFNISYEYAIKF